MPSRAVVLAHGSPLAFAEVRSPALPVDFALLRFQQSFFFARHGRAILPDQPVFEHKGAPVRVRCRA